MVPAGSNVCCAISHWVSCHVPQLCSRWHANWERDRSEAACSCVLDVQLLDCPVQLFVVSV